MIIQKIDIKYPKSSPKGKVKLTHSSSSCQLSSHNDFNNILNLPTIQTNDSKLKNDSIKLSHLSIYDLRNFNINNKNKNNGLYLQYKPRRFIKFKKGQNGEPFHDFRYLPLNEDKVFHTIDKDNNINSNQHLINFSSKKSNGFFDEDNLKLKKYAFRSEYMLKMEKNIEIFDKLKLNNNIITPNKIGIFDDLTYRISKIMSQHKLFFFQNLYEIDEESLKDINNNNCNNINNNNTLPSSNNISINTSNVIKNNNNSNKNMNMNIDFGKIIKKGIVLFCEFNSLINKLFSFLLNEINTGKIENFKLLQKNHEEEIIINSRTKSLNELNTYLNRYDVDTKINYIKKQEEKRKNLKESYNIKENEYISQIYKLENDIKILTSLLNKNKKYYNKCREYEEKIDINKKENENMKRSFKKELREKNNLYMLERNKENELNEQLDGMKEIVENLKKEKSDIRKIDLIDRATIRKLENIINEKNENIMMINEELEWYINQNNNMKKIINDKESTIKTMEMKLNKENISYVEASS